MSMLDRYPNIPAGHGLILQTVATQRKLPLPVLLKVYDVVQRQMAGTLVAQPVGSGLQSVANGDKSRTVIDESTGLSITLNQDTEGSTPLLTIATSHVSEVRDAVRGNVSSRFWSA